MTRSRPRVLLASLAAFAFVAPLTWLLGTTVPATAQRSLGTDVLGTRLFPVEIPELQYLRVRGGATVHRIRLVAQNPREVANHAEVRLLVGTFDTRPSLSRGELLLVGTDCVYRARSGAALPNNDLLTFERSAACVPLGGTPTGELRLTLEFDGPGRSALWANAAAEVGVGPDALVIGDRSVAESARTPVVRGFFVDVDPGRRMSRARLLAYVWQLSPSAGWIWVAIACSSGLIWLAVFLLSADGPPSPARREVMTRALAGWCGAAALSLAYAALVPPFQSADEPNHFIGFAAFIHRPGVDVEAAQWARLGHFERIQFRPDEHFTPHDVGVPGIPWNDGGEPDATTRGSAVQWIWRATPSFVRALPAPRLLFALRLMDAAMFALAVGLVFAIVTGLGKARWAELLGIPIFLVPTLPFFAMTVSNYALLASAYVLLAGGIVLDFRDREGAAAAGPIIGAAWIAAVLISRSALPLSPFIAAWLVGRLVVGQRDRRWRSAAIYWIGLSAFAAVGLWLADREYIRAIVSAARLRPPLLASGLLAIFAQPWLVIVAGVCAAGAEYWISARIRAAAVPKLRTAVLGAGRAAALLLLGMLALSGVFPYPTVDAISPATPPPAAHYVRSVLAAGATIFRIARPDFLTSVSFWGGFGWLDTLPPAAFVSALATASGLAFAALFWVHAREARVGPLVRIGFAIVGYVGSMTAYALSVILLTPADLHGRYLLGLYLCMLTIGWSVVAHMVEAGWVRRTGAVRLGVAGACLAVHVFSLGVILTRYF